MGFSNGGSLNLGDSYQTTGLWCFTHIRYVPTVYTADGIIPATSGCAILGKATAAAMTISAPTLAQNGDVLVITSQTNAAHTVTGAGLIADAVTGSPHGTATYAAFKGASMTLMAVNLLWNVIATTGITIT